MTKYGSYLVEDESSYFSDFSKSGDFDNAKDRPALGGQLRRALLLEQ